jgi:hypothetical protein
VDELKVLLMIMRVVVAKLYDSSQDLRQERTG